MSINTAGRQSAENSENTLESGSDGTDNETDEKEISNEIFIRNFNNC